MPKDTLYLLPIVTCISVVAIVAHIIANITLRRRQRDHAQAYLSGSDKIYKYQGAKTIRVFMSFRLLGCIALLALSLESSLFCVKSGKCLDDATAFAWLSRHQAESLVFVICEYLTCEYSTNTQQVYASVLAAISLITTQWGYLAARHDIVLLLSILGIYGYRDLWPLVTYNTQPVDIAEGWILWTKLVVLVLVALGIPLFIPREYVPADPDVSELYLFFLFLTK